MRGMMVLLGLATGCGKLGPDLVFTNENNYSYSADFETTPIEIAAQSNGTIDWSGVTVDIRGRPLDPSTVEQLSLIQATYPVDEIPRLVADNEIGQDDSQDLYVFVNGDHATSCELADFDITNIPLELDLLTEDPDSTWLLSLMNVPNGRIDILSTLLVTPKVGGTGALTFTNGVSALTNLAVDIASATPLETREGIGPYTLDWGSVTEDTFGHELSPLLADELIIAHYSGDVASVENNFLLLDDPSVVSELYRLDVFGVTGESLDGAVSDDGKAFEGFTAEGTWLVGLICTSCATPVPLILAHVIVN